ncbi:MAG: hypothetical protein MPL62_10305 [Alphaproteobacteria bacterium]|nr:hypothetical protein [Alphaproteobacteria bacterium]
MTLMIARTSGLPVILTTSSAARRRQQEHARHHRHRAHDKSDFPRRTQAPCLSAFGGVALTLAPSPLHLDSAGSE